MTLVFRNAFLTILLIVTGVLLVGYGVLVARLFAETDLVALWVAAPELLISVLGLAWLRRVYRKSTSPVVFFLAVFLFCLAADVLRLVQIELSLHNTPYAFGVVLTRVVWAFRLTGLFCLLASSLFVLEFPYQNYGNLVAIAVGAALLLVLGLPLQTTEPDAQLLYPLGDAWGLALFFGLILLVGTVNHLLAWWKSSRDRAQGWEVPSLLVVWLLLVVGWTLSLVLSPLAAVILVPGLVWLGRQASEAALF